MRLGGSRQRERRQSPRAHGTPAKKQGQVGNDRANGGSPRPKPTVLPNRRRRLPAIQQAFLGAGSLVPGQRQVAENGH